MFGFFIFLNCTHSFIFTHINSGFADIHKSLRPGRALLSPLCVCVYLCSRPILHVSLSFLCMFCLLPTQCCVTHWCVSVRKRSQSLGKRLGLSSEARVSLHKEIEWIPNLLSQRMITPTLSQSLSKHLTSLNRYIYYWRALWVFWHFPN